MIQVCYAVTHTIHPADFTYELDGDQDWWLMIHLLTPVELLVEDTYKEVSENHVILFPPHTKASYRACRESFSDNWVRFYTTESYMINSIFPPCTPIYISHSDIVNQLIYHIAIENFFDYKFKEQSIQHLFHLLFDKITEAYLNSYTPVQLQEIIHLRFDIQNNPDFPWSVPTMAKRLNVSTGYMQAIYQKTFGVSCMDDVIHSRIEQAKEYLHHANYTINQIASLCGYHSTEHFCRQFRKLTNVSPSEYRRLYHNSYLHSSI